MGIKWPKSQLRQAENDLCTRVGGTYADIVRCDGSNLWTCLWDSKSRFGPFMSRDAAVLWFDGAVSDLRDGREPVNLPQ